MRWKLLAVVGAAAGGVWWTAHRRNRRPDEPDRWSQVTDPVPRA